MAEVFEDEGRLEDAIAWAQASINDEFCFNSSSKIRASQCLGRCHAARREHALSLTAFDGAMQLAKTGRFLMSEMLTVRGRALAGRKAAGKGAHWGAYTGRQRLSEVIGRMAIGGADDRASLEEALFAE